MTVAVVGEPPTKRDTAALISRLVGLAVNDELLVVYGTAEHRAGTGAYAVLAGLRNRLPRHDVVALSLGTPRNTAARIDTALLGELMELGSLPVVITSAAAAPGVAAKLSTCLQADRILAV
jgi:hypothetical protein